MSKSFFKKLMVEFQYPAITLLLVLTSFGIYKVFGLTYPTEAWMCNQNGYAIRIIDDSVTSEVRSMEAINDPYFKSFVTSLTNYVSSKYSPAESCEENSGKKPMNSLIFVRLPLVTSGNDPLTPPPELDNIISNVTCRLDSPWVKLTIDRSDTTLIQAIFIWNERQFLADQALLTNPNLSLNSPLVTLSSHLFLEYVGDYANSEIQRSPSEENATKPISQRIPADVLWLFRHSWQSTRGPFSNMALSGMRKTVEQGANGYTNLTKILVDQCFTSSKTDIRYKNVLDLQPIFTLDQYQINQLY
ncbi:hypothetical protein ACN4EE_13330 [Geminocystis sp. CENA526]|uniref:hypothetical protein n=1 Tax=Geminocystis sp. CENA526 TaxID=1355871 RepID=UPI003D6EFAB5